ncbi:hypothetical protein ABFS82_06G128100 [Erythranthe guttata]|uniref:uncharacterized protein LOC105960312 n=1 Tax=Erythranthe guttata TaxID=4155 RepID=UPI00064DE129|nr:PREDICTED: uncharacterized protein LOC105960312 [Erythranthe guttata]|eukprot:XP_012839931.1 PREDICTED: uncharacterized protein LOC105960312 [Erythranthe guttata]
MDASSSSQPRSVRHTTHPGHLLKLVYDPDEFVCDGCDGLGSGSSYSCYPCGFNLHEFCATCPSTTESVFHPRHPLTLVNLPMVNNRVCDLCGDYVCGLFYTCRPCGFDVHPLCTQLPVHVKLPMHRHSLKLKPGAVTACDLCDEDCTSWRYSCGNCQVDIHLECALEDDDDDEIVEPPPPPPRKAVSGGYYREPPPMSMGYNNQYRPPPPRMGYNNQYQPPPPRMGYNNQYQPPPPRMGYNNQYQPPPGCSQQSRRVMPAERQKSSGNKKKKIYSIVGRFALNTLATSITGIPMGF